MDQTYSINSGLIFEDLRASFKNYNRNFLIDVVEEAFRTLLFYKNIFTVKFDGNNGEYLDNYSEFRYPKALSRAENIEEFPFPSFFLRLQKDINHLAVVNYSSSLEINKEEDNYDLFFALKFSLMDIMKADAFLLYHLENSFHDDYQTYKTFLNNICLKYNHFLNGPYEFLVNRFFDTHQTKAEILNENDEGVTTRRQVMILHYMAKELGLYAKTDKTEIARVGRILLGKEKNIPDIRNGNIYKYLKKLYAKGDKALESDLRYLRPQLEKLGMQRSVDEINSELAKRG